jgi:3-hydroxy acid dehydrogenase / malonic semialdehyde reductase
LMPRHLLVTGATSGIGRAIAQAALDRGHRVVGTGRDWTKFPCDHPDFKSLTLDLADLDALPKRLEAIAAAHPGIDALICNAGMGRFGHLEQFSYAQIRQLLDVDFIAHAFAVRAFLPGFKAAGCGDIIFMGSEAALRGSRQGSVYCAAKFALRGFAQALRTECAASSVRVSLVNPGMARTPFFDDLDFAPGPDPEHALEASQVAAAVLHALEAPLGTVIDEINLSPLKHAIDFGKRTTADKTGKAKEKEK